MDKTTSTKRIKLFLLFKQNTNVGRNVKFNSGVFGRNKERNRSMDLMKNAVI